MCSNPDCCFLAKLLCVLSYKTEAMTLSKPTRTRKVRSSKLEMVAHKLLPAFREQGFLKKKKKNFNRNVFMPVYVRRKQASSIP